MANKYRGKVGVSSNKGKLRITIPKSVSGKPGNYLGLGLNDTPENRKIAQAKASELETDILYERVDTTLDKYRVLKKVKPAQKIITLLELFETYAEYKKDKVRANTYISKYAVTLNFLKRTNIGKIEIDTSEKPKYLDKIVGVLRDKHKTETALTIVVQLQACLNWAIKFEKLEQLKTNPFIGLKGEIKGTKKKSSDWKRLAFTATERDKILTAIEKYNKAGTRHYHNYYAFCFFTGCRPSEAVALTWDDIIDDYKFINFNKAVIQSENGLESVSGLKTQENRLFPINSQLKEILQDQQSENSEGKRVFSTPRGKIIDTKNLLKNLWEPLLAELGIEYRQAYCTRHTFITLALEAGMSVKDVATLVGNSPEIIFKHYASTDIKTIEVPKI